LLHLLYDPEYRVDVPKRRLNFNCRYVIIFQKLELLIREKKIVGLERDALRLVSTTEEILDRKVAAPV
jgi:hypothetical protein